MVSTSALGGEVVGDTWEACTLLHPRPGAHRAGRSVLSRNMHPLLLVPSLLLADTHLVPFQHHLLLALGILDNMAGMRMAHTPRVGTWGDDTKGRLELVRRDSIVNRERNTAAVVVEEGTEVVCCVGLFCGFSNCVPLAAGAAERIALAAVGSTGPYIHAR